MIEAHKGSVISGPASLCLNKQQVMVIASRAYPAFLYFPRNNHSYNYTLSLYKRQFAFFIILEHHRFG